MPDLHEPNPPVDEDGTDDLGALRAIGRGVGPRPSEGWEAPPDGLWDRIEAEALPGAHADRPGPTDPTADAAGGPVDAPPAASSSEPPPDGPTADADIVPIGRSRRPRRWLVPVAAAAAAVLAAVGIGVVVSSSSDDVEVVASVDLEALGDAGSGRADLVDADGVRQIRLETTDLDAGDGFHEVWMIDPTVTRLVSLGPLRPDGVYDLPSGVDPAEFPVVDISVEPVDGDPTHSGNSVLRGQLEI